VKSALGGSGVPMGGGGALTPGDLILMATATRHAAVTFVKPAFWKARRCPQNGPHGKPAGAAAASGKIIFIV
jgi:hypothetical protein